jgi:hypothetical protein
MQGARIFFVDDHPLVREWLTALIFVLPIDGAVRIRTDERGDHAV